jgi:glycine/D-amino acid oxidase-like deaminating enzyme
MGPTVDPVQSDEKLPARVDVVVVGGGIIGSSTALELAERGVAVALCEKGGIAAEQSSRNWGWVRKMGRDPRELPLIIESLRLWEGLAPRIGADVGFRRNGILYACNSDADLSRREAWLEHARPYQLDTRMLSAEETAALLPGANCRFKGALYTASDGRAEPQKAAPAIARAAQRRGAAILLNCAVRGVEQAGGRISGVVTERGFIARSAVVLAGGAWSSLFCASLGLRLPQLKVLGSVLRTEPLEGPPTTAVWADGFAFRKRLDGGYTVANGHGSVADIVPDSFRYFADFLPALALEWRSLSFRIGRRFVEEWRTPRRWPLDETTPFERVRILDPMPRAGQTVAALARLALAIPAFASARVAQHWAGLIDVMPDAVPVISAVDARPGFFVATGFSGHGFGIGPAAGRLMADLVTGAEPIVDPTPFRFTRFTDGSKPRPIAGL